jgi:hypothetical protein
MQSLSSLEISLSHNYEMLNKCLIFMKVFIITSGIYTLKGVNTL